MRKYGKPNNKNSEKQFLRLNQYLSKAGICSRRKADHLIKDGLIKVNGIIVKKLGTQVSHDDTVTYKGKPVRLEKKVYILLNKPRNYISTTKDTKSRQKITDLVKDATSKRIYPAGRLDRNTTGVLLLTNDGELTRKLTHPSGNIKKVYKITLDRAMPKKQLIEMIEKGIPLEDGIVFPDKARYLDNKFTIELTLHSGKNRVIRRVFDYLGYIIKSLDRTRFGSLTKNNVPRGKWRFLTSKEINILKNL